MLRSGVMNGSLSLVSNLSSLADNFLKTFLKIPGSTGDEGILKERGESKEADAKDPTSIDGVFCSSTDGGTSLLLFLELE